MKTKVKFIMPFNMMVSFLLIAGSCKPPVEVKEISVDILTATSIDTIAKVGIKKVMTVTTETVTEITKTSLDVKAGLSPLTIIINDLASSTAPLIVGVYNSKDKFLYKEGRLKEYTFTPQGNTFTATITDINYGEIALAVYQDMNSNGKLDKNFIGMPTEGYCFSNNFKPKVKAPDYDNCKFNYDSIANTVTMDLIK